MMQSLYAVAAAVANSDVGKEIVGMGVGTQQRELDVGQSFSLGGLTAVVGMVVVFIGLILLIVLISVMSRVLRQRKAPKEEPQVPAAPVVHEEPVRAAAPVEAVYAPPEADYAPAEAALDEDEIVAAIAAALLCVQAGEKRHPGGFVVRSIRRIGSSAPAWGHAGRRDAMG